MIPVYLNNNKKKRKMAFSSDNCMLFVKQSLPPNYLSIVSVPRPVIRRKKKKNKNKKQTEGK